MHGFGLLEDLATLARRPVEDPSGYPNTDVDISGKDSGREGEKNTERFTELIDRISRDPETFHALADEHLHSFHSHYLDQCLKVIAVIFFYFVFLFVIEGDPFRQVPSLM